ncbi:hypothetical protein HGG75_24320 [Ochrobactrum pseudogrignonense]|nr:hypothetical protein [Brucella pseudogrignonensis]
MRLNKNGTRLDVRLTVSPVRDGSGRIIGASKSAHDISDQKIRAAATGNSGRDETSYQECSGHRSGIGASDLSKSGS